MRIRNLEAGIQGLSHNARLCDPGEWVECSELPFAPGKENVCLLGRLQRTKMRSCLCESTVETPLFSYSIIATYPTSQKNVARSKCRKELRCSGDNREKDS